MADICHRALWFPLYAPDRVSQSFSCRGWGGTSVACTHSFQIVRCALKNTASKRFKNVGYAKKEIYFSDSFRTLMCHSQPSPFSKTNKRFAFRIFLMLLNWIIIFFIPDMMWDFFRIRRGINVIVNTPQGIRSRTPACSTLTRKGLADMKALLNSLELHCFGEAFVNLTRWWVIPLPGAGNNPDVLRKSRLPNSPNHKRYTTWQKGKK